MNILVATKGKKGLEDTVSSVFGRAKTFTMVSLKGSEVQESQTKVYDNKYSNDPSNAGIKAAQFASSKNAEVVVAGSIKENARRVLENKGIEVVEGHSEERVEDAVQDYVKPKEKATTKNKIKKSKEETKTSASASVKTPVMKNSAKTVGMIIAVVIIVATLAYYLMY